MIFFVIPFIRRGRRASSPARISRNTPEITTIMSRHFPPTWPNWVFVWTKRDLRRAILANMADEKGLEDTFGKPTPAHSELWLDFAEGIGTRRDMQLTLHCRKSGS